MLTPSTTEEDCYRAIRACLLGGAMPGCEPANQITKRLHVVLWDLKNLLEKGNPATEDRDIERRRPRRRIHGGGEVPEFDIVKQDGTRLRFSGGAEERPTLRQQPEGEYGG
jgi:hypothetical protein